MDVIINYHNGNTSKQAVNTFKLQREYIQDGLHLCEI